MAFRDLVFDDFWQESEIAFYRAHVAVVEVEPAVAFLWQQQLEAMLQADADELADAALDAPAGTVAPKPRVETGLWHLDRCSDADFIVRASAYMAAAVSRLAVDQIDVTDFQRIATRIGAAAASINPHRPSSAHAA